MRRGGILVILVCAVISGTVVAQEKAMSTAIESPNVAHEGVRAPLLDAAQKKLESELAGKYGEGQRERARRGLKQVGEFWRAEDGDQAAFEAFVRANFAGDQATLDTTFARFERLMEQLEGSCRRSAPASSRGVIVVSAILARTLG